MKKLLLVIFAIGLLSSCKQDTAAKTDSKAKTEQTSSNKNVKTGPAVRDGNVIRQKVTVGGNQNMDINAKTALVMIKSNPNLKILDVRTEKEVSKGIYPNAMHIDVNKPSFESEIDKLDKKGTYIVYCKSGGRSGKAVSKMRELGFMNSYNMTEGYKGFTKASKK